MEEFDSTYIVGRRYLVAAVVVGVILQVTFQILRVFVFQDRQELREGIIMG